MSDGYVNLNPDGLTDVLTRIFVAAGGSDAEARAIGRNLVEANLSGHDSHGVVRTQRYVDWLNEGLVHFNREVETIIDAGTFCLLDGQFGYGQTLGVQAVEIGLAKAREHGVSIVGLRNSGHLGRIGAWAEMACDAGIVSVHFVNAYHSQLVAPFGGRERRMGTNPVAVGVPHPDGDFILDFATSTVAEGKVLVAARGGKPLPDDALVNEQGQLTADTHALYGDTPEGEAPHAMRGPGAITAMGRHKGSGLSMACELLAGALTGSGTCGPGYKFHNGMLSFYIDPDRMDDGHDWASSVNEYIEWVRECAPMDPNEPVLYAGQPERQRRAERAECLPLPAPAWDSILATGQRLNLDRTRLAALAEI